MEGLSEFEIAVLDKLLEGDDSILADLRLQAARSRLASRTYTDVGFYCDLQVPEEVPRVSPANFTVDDVHAEVAGLTAGAMFVLFIRNGYITSSEGISVLDEGWPEFIKEFKLHYNGGATRTGRWIAKIQ